MYAQLAKKIPDKIRSQRLLTDADPIFNSEAVSSNPQMQLLFLIYTEFVFPGKEEDITCWKCLQRIQYSFRQMKPELERLEKEYRLLKGIQ